MTGVQTCALPISPQYSSSDASFHVVSFFEIVDNKITSLDEYWGEDGDVPQWRKEKRIGKPIQ